MAPDEIARLFGMHRNAVRSWLNQGLAAIDDRRPILILGQELSHFLPIIAKRELVEKK